MRDSTITIVRLSDSDLKTKIGAVQTFLECFPVYKRISRDERILTDFFMSTFDFDLCYTALADTKVAGFLAVSQGKTRSLKFDKTVCIAQFGQVMGTIIYHQMAFILGRPNLEHEKDVGIDHLATGACFRGKGIATGLIEYACGTLCHGECFIEVASNNAVAKRLYEHLGFSEYEQSHSVINRLLGFGYISRMKKIVPQPCI